MKNVLIIYYSQSGQLKQIADNLCSPLLNDPNVNVDYCQIKMKKDFPFPWDKESFFGAFPDAFLQNPHEIENPPKSILDKDYDLILLHYQVWYLSPSIPINSFLKSDFSKKIFRNKPVITISGSRNMWAFAQDKIKELLKENQATLVGNIALTDRNINLISVVTVVDWMFSGVKRKAYSIFPLPGVSDQEIKSSSKFGEIIKKYLHQNQYENLQKELVLNNAVEYRWFLVSMDKKANRLFKIWANLFKRNPEKKSLLIKLFNLYLLFVIWIVSPIVHLIETIVYPLFYFQKKKQKRYYQGIK